MADVPMLTEVVPACGTTTGVIPLSVEMLSDSDDEEDIDCKPHLSTLSSLSACQSHSHTSVIIIPTHTRLTAFCPELPG